MNKAILMIRGQHGFADKGQVLLGINKFIVIISMKI